MNTRNLKSKKTEGSVLMMSLMTAFTIGLTLASYLLMVQQQNTSVYRSQTWNSSVAVAEAGIEEGLAHLNSAEVRTLDYASNAWTNDGSGNYALTRKLGDSYYT